MSGRSDPPKPVSDAGEGRASGLPAFSGMPADEGHAALLRSLKAELPALRRMQELLWSEEVDDALFRFWHLSLKVFRLQDLSEQAFGLLRSLPPVPGRLSPLLLEMVQAGTGYRFSLQDNGRWLQAAGPVVLTFLQLRWLVDAAVWSAEHLDVPPMWLPPRWAALLDVFELR